MPSCAGDAAGLAGEREARTAQFGLVDVERSRVGLCLGIVIQDATREFDIQGIVRHGGQDRAGGDDRNRGGRTE